MSRCYRIALFNEETSEAITFEIKTSKVEESQQLPTTNIPYRNNGLLLALANALKEVGVMPGGDQEQELKATKHHLEDMRKIAMHELDSLRRV